MTVHTKRDESGFAAIEGVLIVVIIGIIGFAGWFVVHAKHNATTALNNAAASAQTTTASSKLANTTAAKTVTPVATTPAANTDNGSLDTDLNSINGSQTQESQDMSSTNTGLNDQQSKITVPTN